MATPVFEFQNVNFCYPDEKVPALCDISCAIYPGEIVVLAGQSGCGKSTLLKHMKKNTIPFGEGNGALLFCGEDLEKMPDKKAAKSIGYVGQDPENQLVTDKVYHELAFGLENMGISTAQMQKKVAEISEYLGISHLFRRTTATLSGGQKQMLNLASVLVMKPELLILDEPVSQMDPIAANRFIQTLVRLNQDFGTTIFIAEQRLEEILPVADRILYMQGGRLLADGKADACMELLAHVKKQTGTKPAIEDALPAAARIYAACSVEINHAPLSVRQGRNWLKNELSGRFSEREENQKSVADNVRIKEKEKTALKAKNISFSYEKGKEVLSDFSIDIPEGKCTAILGGNGSGKTTAIKILSGVYDKGYRGKVKKSGRVLYLAQNPQSLFTEMTAHEELCVMLADTDDAIQVQKKTADMFRFLELEGLENKNPLDLSGGEKQRLALGKILLKEPELLFLDEPTKGLDAAFKKRLSELFRDLCNRGMTIVMVSHDLEFCAENAQYCGLLFDGSMVSFGKTRDFFAGNSFYTTAVGRMTDGILPGCLLYQDVIEKMRNEECK